MGIRSQFCVTCMCLWSFVAFGGENQCTNKNLVLDISQEKDFSGFLWTLPLPSFSAAGGLHDTGAVVDFLQDNFPYMRIMFRFDLPEDNVANPYNIYRLEFDVGEGSDAFHYEFGDCTGSVGSFWPKDPLKVYPIEITPHQDGSPRGTERLRVRIWGHQ